MIEGWWIVFGMYVVGLLHHVLAMRSERRARSDQLLLQRQLDLLREAIALSEYGAREEARAMIDEAAALKAKWRV